MTKTKRFNELRNRINADPDRRERVADYKEAMQAAIALYELRKQRQMTQCALADIMKTSQANVSRIERGDDLYLSTLRGYIKAMGGHLEICAVFPDGTFPIDPAFVAKKLEERSTV
jgi:transcriptional regulator with XRE-family HTH domain